jgi:hypothetical protein
MKKIYIGLFLINFALPACFAKGNADPKMPAKWHRLNKLINQEEKTIRGLRKLGPRLRWRLLELNTERLKLVKEKENKIFIEASIHQKNRKSKKLYFRQSSKLYEKIRKDGLSIIKKWPYFKYSADIYYTLALNSREYAEDKHTEQYLLKSLKKAMKNSPIVHSSKTALAEHYYNNKIYSKAIKYYKDVLKNKKDEWYSKHLYNLSWCYIKVKKYDNAISHAKRSHRASKKKKYIDVSPQVLQSIGFYFVLAARVEEGSEYFIKHEKKPAHYMIKMAKKAAEDLGFKKSNYIFNQALENATSKNAREEEIKIRLAQLDFFRNFKRFGLYQKTAMALETIDKKTPMDEDQKSEAVEKIKSFVGYLQIRFTKNKKIGIYDHNPKRRKTIIRYFNILSNIDSKDTDFYRFYQGETFFAVGMFGHALRKYQQSLEHAKKLIREDDANLKKVKLVKNNVKIPKGVYLLDKEEKEKHIKLQRKVFDSMLASLEKKNLKKKERYNYTVYTYDNHLTIYPVGKRSQLIYKKLFNVYLKEKNMEKAHPAIERYKKNFPQDIKIQRQMFTQVMDHFISIKDSNALATWVSKLEKGYLKFEIKYIEQASIILGKILFEEYQVLDNKGEKQKAAKGYISLYSNKKYPKSVKAKAAFNAGLLYLDLAKTKESLKWIKLSLALFTEKEKWDRHQQFSALTQRYMKLQDFKSSSKIGTISLNLFCQKKFKEKNSLFLASVNYALIDNRPVTASTNFKNGKKCTISKKVQDQMLVEIGSFYLRNRKYQSFYKFFSKYNKTKSKSLRKFLSGSLIEVYWDLHLQKRTSSENKLIKFLKKAMNKGELEKSVTSDIRHIINFSPFIKKAKSIVIDLYPNNQKFDEKVFNLNLESNISKLKALTNEASPFIKSGNPHFMLQTYQVLELKYNTLSKLLIDFTPIGVPKDYVTGFKQAMSGLGKQIKGEATQYNRIGKQLISQNEVLSPYTMHFSQTPAMVKDIGHRHPASFYILPIDKSGRPGGRK